MSIYTIDFFYSKEFSEWVIILLDKEGNQVADALYRPYKREAKKVTEEDFHLYHWAKEE